MSRPAYDAVVVGAGHNGLIAACYLARAGQRVLVCDARARPGGAVNTEELFPGFRLDTCSTFHVLIHLTPVLRLLDLARSACAICATTRSPSRRFPEAAPSSSGKTSTRPALGLPAWSAPATPRPTRASIDQWWHFNRPVFEDLLEPPTPGALAGHVARQTMRT